MTLQHSKKGQKKEKEKAVKMVKPSYLTHVQSIAIREHKYLTHLSNIPI